MPPIWVKAARPRSISASPPASLRTVVLATGEDRAAIGPLQATPPRHHCFPRNPGNQEPALLLPGLLLGGNLGAVPAPLLPPAFSSHRCLSALFPGQREPERPWPRPLVWGCLAAPEVTSGWGPEVGAGASETMGENGRKAGQDLENPRKEEESQGLWAYLTSIHSLPQMHPRAVSPRIIPTMVIYVFAGKNKTQQKNKP